VFGKSVTDRPKPRARRIEPLPPLPLRTFALGFVAVVGCAYAIARHYTMHGASPVTNATSEREREIPAPEIVPIEK
jgi:hypothetical protein